MTHLPNSPPSCASEGFGMGAASDSSIALDAYGSHVRGRIRRDDPMTKLAARQLPPSARDAEVARASGQQLSRYVREKRSLLLRVHDAGQDEEIELPAGAVALLMSILESMAAGRGVTLIPESAELTTFEAADVLRVSRPYLIKLLDEGEIPHRKVGRHRRVRLEDVMAYRARDDRDRAAVLDDLVRDAQEQDMGYRRP